MPPEDEAVDTGAAPATVVDEITPPPGAGMPTDDGGDAPPAKPAKETSKTALPASVKAPVKGDGTSRFNERISTLVQQRKESNERAERAEAELTRMRTGAKPNTDGSTNAAASKPGDGELNPDNFDTYPEYIKALTEATIAKAAASKESADSKAAYERYTGERKTSFNEQAAPFAAEYGDGFWEAISDPNLPVSEIMYHAVLELSDGLGPLTMLYLAGNKQEAAKIAAMNPMAATVQIGRIAARLDHEMKSGSSAGPETVPQNPNLSVASPQAPTRPVPKVIPDMRGGTVTDVSSDPSDKDDMATWVAKEAARMRGKYGPNAKFYH